MSEKVKYYISFTVLLTITYFLFLGIFSSLTQGKIIGQYLNNDAKIYSLQADGYIKDRIPEDIRCIGTENIDIDYGYGSSAVFGSTNYSYEKYNDHILFYNNVKDNLKIDVDLENYHMAQFQNKYPTKTIFPVIISSDLNDKYKVGDEYYSFDFTNSYSPIKISFIVVGYNDYLFNSVEDGYSFAVVNQRDYSFIQNYTGINCNYSCNSKPSSYDYLIDILKENSGYINFIQSYDDNARTFENKLVKSSIFLNNVERYNEDTDYFEQYLIGRKPSAPDEIVVSLNISDYFSRNELVKLHEFILRGEYFDLNLFTSKNGASLSKKLKIVGFCLKGYNKIVLSDALFDEIQSKISYKNYDDSIDKNNFKLVNTYNSYTNKSDAISLTLKYSSTQIVPVIANNTVLIIVEILVLLITIYLAYKYIKNPTYILYYDSGEVIEKKYETKTLIYSKKNIKTKLYILFGIVISTLIITLLIMKFKSDIGVNIFTIIWSYGLFFTVLIIEEVVKYLVYKKSVKKDLKKCLE